MINPKLLQIFLDESEDLLRDLEDGLVALEADGGDLEQINRVFRAAHTMKGNAGLTGIEEIVEFTHAMENVLDRVRDGTVDVTPTLVTVLLEGTDILKTMVALVAEGRALDKVPGRERNLGSLRRFLGVEGARPSLEPAPKAKKAQAAPRVYEVTMALGEGLLATGQDPLLLIEELADHGEVLRVDADLSRLPSFDDLDPEKLYLGWRVALRTSEDESALRNIFIFVVDENDISIEDVTERFKGGVDLALADKKLGEILVGEGVVSEAEVEAALSKQQRTGQLLVETGKVPPAKIEEALERQQAAREVRGATSIRVDIDKLDRLVNLVGELVIAVARVGQVLSDEEVDLDDRIAAQEALDRVSRDLQDQVMSVRMVPVDATFNRFKRVVRDLARELGKSIELETEGTETELDKNVIEQLVDPLKHLVRNAVDHGIERPEVREAAGKPAQGTVWLRAAQREGSIVIDVADDGAGLDREKILATALERGLVEPGAELADREVWDLLFQPGFSTAKEVTTISGRGVGLDVVRQNIAQLRGAVDLLSEPGQGTTFRIKLPLTLAIIDGMKVQVGAEILTIPLLSIVEQVRPSRQQLRTVEGKGEVVLLRGEVLPLVRLHELFGFPTERTDPTEALVVIVENEGRKYSLLVDDVLGQEQAVIKSLDSNYRTVDGVSGATILGDGNVSLILDPHRIEQIAFN